ncbi:hypothetical protein PSAB6_250249 [Paraburkholderia sabiae]|nr:hypothetical protein PSAB6_250249 [Paraburkholderia sabiae]
MNARRSCPECGGRCFHPARLQYPVSQPDQGSITALHTPVRYHSPILSIQTLMFVSHLNANCLKLLV